MHCNRFTCEVRQVSKHAQVVYLIDCRCRARASCEMARRDIIATNWYETKIKTLKNSVMDLSTQQC